MSHDPRLPAQSGGFGPKTFLTLESGLRARAGIIVPGTRLAGGRVVLSAFRMRATEALVIGGGLYSAANLFEIGSDAHPIRYQLCPQIEATRTNMDLIFIGTDTHNIETDLGLMSDFWITQERYESSRNTQQKGRPVDV